jgi:hypothetical protein
MSQYKRWRKPLLTAHVTVAVSWLGASFALWVLGIAEAASADVFIHHKWGGVT